MNTATDKIYRHFYNKFSWHYAFIAALLCCVQLSTGCKGTSSVYGTYFLSADKRSKLVLEEDSSFILNTFKNDSFCYNTGKFYSRHHTLLLSSLPVDSNTHTATFTDSVSFFTNITSFSFWNKDGEVIPIRRIQIGHQPANAHYGNSLYYFVEDFKATDTLRFYFQGYPTLSYPGNIQSVKGNNGHKITLTETYLPDVYYHTPFLIKRNKLRCKPLNETWKKKQKR